MALRVAYESDGRITILIAQDGVELSESLDDEEAQALASVISREVNMMRVLMADCVGSA